MSDLLTILLSVIWILMIIAGGYGLARFIFIREAKPAAVRVQVNSRSHR